MREKKDLHDFLSDHPRLNCKQPNLKMLRNLKKKLRNARKSHKILQNLKKF